MIEIKDLLAKFSNILLGEENKIESVRSVIKEVVGLELKKEDIKIKNNTVFLNIKPIYKSEIFLKKDRILSKLGQYFGKRVPGDIR